MSLIENAIKRLQGAVPAAAPGPRPGGSRPVRPVVPEAHKKKVVVDGPRHHVSQAELVRAGLLAPLDQATSVADEFRAIKRPLIANAFSQHGMSTGHENVIMVTSPLPGAGKTFCSMNLAVSMSLERDLNVLLVDADVAKRHVTRELGLQDAPGLIDLLVDDGTELAKVLVRTDLNDIQVLPAGRTHPQATELLASERMARLVHELSAQYADRVVLFDSPPLLVTSEAQALASQVGQITLIVEAGKTTYQELARAVEVLGSDKAVNAVLNKSRNWKWLRGGEYSGEYGYDYSGS